MDLWGEIDNVELIIEEHRLRKAARRGSLLTIDLTISRCSLLCDIAQARVEDKHYERADQLLSRIRESMQRIRNQCARLGRCRETGAFLAQVNDLEIRTAEIAATVGTVRSA
jgi:methionine aminopeptidase